MIRLPYFDQLLEGRHRGEAASLVFERNVHWGYWENPAEATRDSAQFAEAMDRMNSEVIAAGSIQHGQTLLDVGCGLGGTLASLAARHERLRLTGLNIDPRQLEIARQQVPGASFVEGDACALPFEAATFDRVLAVECIFHFSSRLAFLKEAARVLRPGGRLALSDFVPSRLSYSRSGLWRFIQRQMGKGYGDLSSDWSCGSYRAMAAAAGLAVVVERDITVKTLPTYPAILDLLHTQRTTGRIKDRMIWPTRLLRWASELGLVRYQIFGFEKI